MDDLLVDREQWVRLDAGMNPNGVSEEDWKKINMKPISTV